VDLKFNFDEHVLNSHRLMTFRDFFRNYIKIKKNGRIKIVFTIKLITNGQWYVLTFL
jgi:hypothetical protein